MLKTRFAARGTTQGTLLVPEGMLAVSVALDDPSHAGPFTVVGSKVAVLDTFNVQEGDKSGTTPAGDGLQDRHEYTRATRLLLPSVEVLAVGQSTTVTAPYDARDTSGHGTATAAGQDTTTLFTLAVTQDQAERLVLASRTGALTFALAGPKAIVAPGAGQTDRTLFGVTK